MRDGGSPEMTLEDARSKEREVIVLRPGSRLAPGAEGCLPLGANKTD